MRSSFHVIYVFAYPHHYPALSGRGPLNQSSPLSPQAAAIGAISSEVLSPTPPVECLSAFGASMSEKSIIAPDRSIASVSCGLCDENPSNAEIAEPDAENARCLILVSTESGSDRGSFFFTFCGSVVKTTLAILQATNLIRPYAGERMKIIIPLLLSCALFTVVSFGQTVTVQPSISVIGEAELQVTPDQIVFTFEVVTTDPKLATAKKTNDTAAAKTIAVAKGFNIPDEDLQTDRLTVSPRMAGEKDPRGKGTVIGYEVTKRFLVTFKQLDRIDEFLSKAIDAGVNRIVNIDIGNSEMPKYEQQGRLLAVDNAQSKAEAYAKRLGLKVGRAYVIREENADTPGYTTGYASGSGYGDPTGFFDKGNLSVPSAYSREVTFALGKISVADKIYVTFELKP
jgi:uncharacterized protein